MYFKTTVKKKLQNISAVYHRHVKCNSQSDDTLLPEVRFAKCGKQFKKIIGWDANGQ